MKFLLSDLFYEFNIARTMTISGVAIQHMAHDLVETVYLAYPEVFKQHQFDIGKLRVVLRNQLALAYPEVFFDAPPEGCSDNVFDWVYPDLYSANYHHYRHAPTVTEARLMGGMDPKVYEQFAKRFPIQQMLKFMLYTLGDREITLG